ncbi:MAG: prepilin-type N-terminal cleavage/methylation domain-containing protein [Candidatus Zixiibacteriota bacterium]
MMNSRKLGENGITLLEVMVSMIILAMGILALAPLIGIAIYNNTYANDITIANELAQKEIETILNRSSFGSLPYISTKDSVYEIYSVYERVDDESTDASVPAGTYKITVRVSWIDQQNVPRTVSYLTLKSKP